MGPTSHPHPFPEANADGARLEVGGDPQHGGPASALGVPAQAGQGASPHYTCAFCLVLTGQGLLARALSRWTETVVKVKARELDVLENRNEDIMRYVPGPS